MIRNKKEGIIFGACFCMIMAFFMGLMNISIHMGGFSKVAMITSLKAFPLTVVIAFTIESLIIRKINHRLLKKFSSESDSLNANILFNCFFIVTMMSFIMTYVGGLLGGDSIRTIASETFVRWPRNFWAAFFLNILIAGPISRFLLRFIQKRSLESSVNKSMDYS